MHESKQECTNDGECNGHMNRLKDNFEHFFYTYFDSKHLHKICQKHTYPLTRSKDLNTVLEAVLTSTQNVRNHSV